MLTLNAIDKVFHNIDGNQDDEKEAECPEILHQ